MPKERRIIGVDEAGKGDFFGPLVIAAFLAPADASEKLLELGVRDGKLIANAKLMTLDERLRALYPHAVVIISPEEYNNRYDKIKNLNKLLAEGHAEAIERVLAANQADKAISDKFGKPELIEMELRRRGVTLPLEQIVRGEEILQVAAASMLARAAFLREMQKLSARLKMEVPRGAGAITDEAGRKIVRAYPDLSLREIAKTHFKNYHRIVHPTLRF